MASKDLLIKTLDDASYQLEQVFKDMPASAWNDRLTEHARTPQDTLSHLAESYIAYGKQLQGISHEWGSFKLEGAPQEQLEAWRKHRQEAVEAAVNSGKEGSDDAAMEYLALHEAYHVGQLCLLRLKHEPSWDPYSIYRF
jgi:uncharacterized damage-inducible protein DinB